MYTAKTGGCKGVRGLDSTTIVNIPYRNDETAVYVGKFHYKKMSENARYYPSIMKIYDKKWCKRPPKVVVFDLDETIGSFTDLYLIWKTIFTKQIYCGDSDRTTTQKIFNELLDLYPEFLRYGILHILEFIKTKIQTGESHRIYLYTNNQCDFSIWTKMSCPNPTEWVEMIIIYLNIKLDAKETIFAKPICAFKINNRVVEPLRETTNKTHRDFLKCSILPKTTEICFIDDSYHDKMKHNKVYYIQPPPYVNSLNRDDIISRFVHSKLHSRLRQSFSRVNHAEPVDVHLMRLLNGISVEPYDSRPPSVLIPRDDFGTHHPHPTPPREAIFTNARDAETFKKLMYYIKEFFCMTTQCTNTRRKYFRIGKFTRKKYRKRCASENI